MVIVLGCMCPGPGNNDSKMTKITENRFYFCKNVLLWFLFYLSA